MNLDEIDFQSEVQAPVGRFYAALTDPVETVISWRRTTAEQALYYLEHRSELIDRYAGQYILLQEGQVRWHSDISDLAAAGVLAGERRDQALWMKYVDPNEAEDERFAVYEHALAQSASDSLTANKNAYQKARNSLIGAEN